MTATSNPFVFGTSELERIVSCERNPRTGMVDIFLEGEAEPREYEIPLWLLSNEEHSPGWLELRGNLHYRYMKTFGGFRELWDEKRRGGDYFHVYDERESAMLVGGFTYYKGLRLQDVSTLAFDIESTSLEHGPDARVLIISNTFRRNGQVERKMFCYDDYSSDAEMFDAWCEWVRERNPSIIVGHNIYTYDLPYLQFCAARAGTQLRLGRDGSPISVNRFESKFRRDGSQFYSYNGMRIYGREIVDTFFLAMKYDFARKYDSYALKQIIKQEGLEVQGRQHYDASKIRDNYKDPAEWVKIRDYAEHDADDALALFDLMASSFFYLARAVPKTFQQIINGASGAQINSFLIRSYLQLGHSIPAPSEVAGYEGAISYGRPGIYGPTVSFDIASMYPSIIISNRIYDRTKDPYGHFLKMVEYFRDDRLRNKKLGQETGDRYYKDLEQMGKVFVNSAYGLLGAHVNFNSPALAAEVTRTGRDLLRSAIKWVTGRTYEENIGSLSTSQ